MLKDLQIGGDYYCNKCGQYCSGAEYHDCPKDKLPKEVRMIELEIERQEKIIREKESELKSVKEKKKLFEKVLKQFKAKGEER